MKKTIPKMALVDRLQTREPVAAPVLDTPSDWSAKNFVDLNFKVSEPIRRKHWKEAAFRGLSSKKLYLMAMQAFYEQHGSLIEKVEPESAGIEALEIERGR